MSEIGNRLRNLFTEIAPPIDVEGIVQTSGVPVEARRGWLVALAAAAVVLVFGMGSFLLFGGSDRPAETADGSPATVNTSQETSTPSTFVESTTTVPENGFGPQVIHPVRIKCTSEVANFPCSALVDGDETTRWNAVEGGVGAEIVLFFYPPVQITSIYLLNVGDPEAFARNARIRVLKVVFDDLPQATVVELNDTYAQSVQVETLRTSIAVLHVTSAYPGQAYEGKEPFTELALAEIQVWGRVAPEVNTPDGQQLPSTIDLSSVDRPALEAAALYVGRVDSQVRFIQWLVTDINDQWEGRQITFDDAIGRLTYVATEGFPGGWGVPPQDLTAVLPAALSEELRGVGAALAPLEGVVDDVIEGFRAPDDGTLRRAAFDRFDDASANLHTRIEAVQSDIRQALASLGSSSEPPTCCGSHFMADADGWTAVDVWEAADASGGQLTMSNQAGATLVVWTGTTAEDQAAIRDMEGADSQTERDGVVNDERVAGSLWVLGSEATVYSPQPTIHFVSWVDPGRGLVVLILRDGTLLDLTQLLGSLRLVDDSEWRAMVDEYPSTGPVSLTTIPQEIP